MSDLDKYVEELKHRLRERCGKCVTQGDNPFANGCTQTGFYPDTVVDFDALCKEIDDFTETFKKEK